MGNNFGGLSEIDEGVKEQSLLSESEIKMIGICYDTNFNNRFENESYPLFIKLLLSKNDIKTSSEFIILIEKMTRKHSFAVPTFYKAFINFSSDSSNIQSAAQDTDNFEIMFRTLLEFLYPKEILVECGIENLNRIVTNLANNIRKCRQGAEPLEQLQYWILRYAPCLPQAIIYAIQKELYGKSYDNAYWGKYAPPQTPSKWFISSLELFPLSLYSNSLQGEFVKLYSTYEDGRSFDRLASQILGYDGPTLIIAKADSNDDVVGMFTTTKWEDKTSTYGNRNNFLYTLRTCKIFPTQGSGENFQWFNLRGYDMPHGLGSGGSYNKNSSSSSSSSSSSRSTSFRFFVPDSMESLIAGSSCLTFEQGSLLGPGTMGKTKLLDLEVWAVGDTETINNGMSGRKAARNIREEKINRARKVDKAAFLQNDFDKEMFLGNTFTHHKQSKER